MRLSVHRLTEGVREFRNGVFKSKRSLFEELEKGQHPLALFITCSDSRVLPNLITQTEPGELFVLRNAGNIVPPYGAVDGGEAASIEYAVKVLGVTDIVICGHSQCGAMGGLLDPSSLEELPAVRSWLGHAELTREIMEANYANLTDTSKRLMTAVEENVLVQMEQLQTHPSVKAAIIDGELNIHGWVYKFETGEISAYDETEGQFVPVAGASEDTTETSHGGNA